MFAFLYEKEKSKEICEEISFSSFFRKMLMSVFLLRIKANYLKKKKKICGFPNFFFLDSNSPRRDLLFWGGPNLVQKPLYLVGTVVNMYIAGVSTSQL